MNILACNIFGADFDGDAMCMFYPNNNPSSFELKYITSL